MIARYSNYLFPNTDEQYALTIAAWHGHHECVSFLVSLGADVNAANKVLIWL